MSFAVLVACGLLGLAAPEGVEPEDPDGLIQEGLTLRREGKDAEALERFQRAYEKAKSPRALAQVALAEQALGRWLPAEKHLSEALAAASDPWISSRRAVLDEALATIRSHLGCLEIVTNAVGARVRLNGVDRGPLAGQGPMVVAPGKVRIELAAPGYAPAVGEVEVAAGATVRQEVPLLAAAEQAGGGGSALTTLGFVAAGGAAVGLILGIVGTAAGAEAGDGSDCVVTEDFDLVCGSPGLRTLGVVGFVSAGVFAAAAIPLFVVGASEGPAKVAAAGTIQVGVGPKGVAASVRY